MFVINTLYIWLYYTIIQISGLLFMLAIYPLSFLSKLYNRIKYAQNNCISEAKTVPFQLFKIRRQKIVKGKINEWFPRGNQQISVKINDLKDSVKIALEGEEIVWQRNQITCPLTFVWKKLSVSKKNRLINEIWNTI